MLALVGKSTKQNLSSLLSVSRKLPAQVRFLAGQETYSVLQSVEGVQVSGLPACVLRHFRLALQWLLLSGLVLHRGR